MVPGWLAAGSTLETSGGAPSGSVVAFSRPGADDAAILSGIVARDPAAIAELFERYGADVRRTLTRALGSTLDVDDLTQETFLTAIDRAGTLRTASALRSFVLGIAVRLAQNELRKRAVRRFVGLDDGFLHGIAPHDPVAREGLARAYRALERLDSTSRMMLVLRRVEELELTEIADAMGVSLATVKRKLARAEKRFDAIAQSDPALRRYLGGAS